jgi:uncharacterized DUF497 family protein
MEFEWDENKNLANIKNHEGVSFEDAAKVFADIWAIDEDDSEHSTTDEKRFTIIGLADTQLLRGTYTVISEDTEDEVFRIISVRKAQSKDKENYEKARNIYDR